MIVFFFSLLQIYLGFPIFCPGWFILLVRDHKHTGSFTGVAIMDSRVMKTVFLGIMSLSFHFTGPIVFASLDDGLWVISFTL